MNIFILDKCPVASAQMQCNKHCVKMILESAQILCAIFPQGKAPYKRTHYNHPCTKWARESVNNYEWLLTHAYALMDEYLHRYGKLHKSLDAIAFCDDNYHKLNLPNKGLTSFAQAMPEKYKNGDAVKAYRTYYIKEKKSFAKWTKREAPDWFNFLDIKMNNGIIPEV